MNYVTFGYEDSRHVLEDALQYTVKAKSKCIRPLLSIATFTMLAPTKKIDGILPLACALEFFHTYSLIHDDLPVMDDDDFRRGQPSCHKKYGEDIAVLAGDTLNTIAFEIMAKELPQYFDPLKITQSISHMSAALGLTGMIGGQVMDIKGSSKNSDADYLKKTHSLKTGAVLKSCIELPAILLDTPEETYEHLSKFGGHLGLLFQIIDDILDSIGTTEELGKTANKDEEQDKLTYTSLYGLEDAQKMAKQEAESAKYHLSQLQDYDVSNLNSLIDYLITRTS